MPQSTSFTPIQLYSSSTVSAVPLAANLTNSIQGAELAINIADGKLFYKDSGGVVQVIGTKGGVGSSTNTQVLYNSSGLVVGNAGLTFNGTGLTSGYFIPSSATIPTNGLFLPTTNTLGFSTNTTEQMRLDASGNLGIGTSSPSYKLDVVGTGTQTIRIQTNTSGNPTLLFTAAGANAGYLQYNRTAQAIQLSADSTNNFYSVDYTGLHQWFKSSASETMRLDASGNLGLGVTPSVWVSGTKALQIGSYGVNWVLSNGVYSGSNYYLNASSQRIYLNSAYATEYLQYALDGSHRWYNAPSGTAGTVVTLIERMRIASSGQLLVNLTTAPLASLSLATYGGIQGHNSGNGGFANISLAGGGQTFYTYTGAMGSEVYTQAMTLDGNGNLGLGVVPSAWTATGQKALQLPALAAISSGFDYSLNATMNAVRVTGGGWQYIQSSQYATQYQQINGQHLWFNAPVGTAGATITFTQAMTLDASGNLGIGTTSPAGKLDITATNAGGITYNYFQNNGAGVSSVGIAFAQSNSIKSSIVAAVSGNDYMIFNVSGNTERMRIDASGRLLIGTTSASGTNKLQVNSDALINSITVGLGGGSVATNTVVGYQAGYSNTTGGSIVFIGYQAGYSNTTSLYGVFIGNSSGYYSTGSYNCFVGPAAGYLVTTGSQNTFIGANNATGASGFYMTTGSKNTIIGAFTGNQGGLDIRTANNYIVLSDGDGNPNLYIDNNKNAVFAGTTRTAGYTVATLPTGVTGMRAYVTNALAPTFGSTVVGGGTVIIPVFYNGTNWIVG